MSGRQLVAHEAIVRDELRVDRQPLAQLEAGLFGDFAQLLDLRPGRLRADVVDRQRRDAAPVVDAREQVDAVGVRRQVRRRLDVHRRARGSAAPSRSCAASRATLGSSRWRIGMSSFTRKFWTITSWMLPCSSLHVADGEERIDALLPRLADADQDARGERDAQLAGSRASSAGAAPGSCPDS